MAQTTPVYVINAIDTGCKYAIYLYHIHYKKKIENGQARDYGGLQMDGQAWKRK